MRYVAFALALSGCIPMNAGPIPDGAVEDASPDLSVPDLAVVIPPDLTPPPPDVRAPPPPDLFVPPPVDRISCRQPMCRPPSCCGAACMTDAQCCFGTFCNKDGKCAPVGCKNCGEVGCAVDYVKCTAACNKPACCLKMCAVDGDCCPGARCQTNLKNERRCVPKTCDACEGFRPICDVTNACDSQCVAPASCGKQCMKDVDCGANNVCKAFGNGTQTCVPQIFDAQCLQQCGLKGCLFYQDKCSLECRALPTDGGGAGPVDAGPDLALPPPDLATPPDLLRLPDGACKGCCSGCAEDFECCPGMSCGSDGKGNKICLPELCAACQFGCSFFCPPP